MMFPGADRRGVPLEVVVGICPACDRTHFAVAHPNQEDFDLTPEQAETIGRQLINPEPL